MGCDIHSVAQVYKDGKWRTVEHRVGGDHRDYDTFAVYANVRNGYGFAGSETGEGWRIIAEPRGLPEDFEIWEEGHHGTWMGDHSHSWLLLSEILKAYEGYAAEEYEKYGVLTRQHYQETIAQGKPPEFWCADKGGRNVFIVDEEKVLKGTAPNDYTDVRCKWKVPAPSRLRTMKEQIDVLKWLPEEHEVTADQVRLVFGFDS